MYIIYTLMLVYTYVLNLPHTHLCLRVYIYGIFMRIFMRIYIAYLCACIYTKYVAYLCACIYTIHVYTRNVCMYTHVYVYTHILYLLHINIVPIAHKYTHTHTHTLHIFTHLCLRAYMYIHHTCPTRGPRGSWCCELLFAAIKSRHTAQTRCSKGYCVLS